MDNSVRSLKAFRSPMAVLIIGVVLFFFATKNLALPWYVVSIPIGKFSDIYRSDPFPIDLDERYEIGVEVNRSNKTSDRLTDCRLGWTDKIQKEACKDLWKKLEMKWRILLDGKVVAQGVSSDKPQPSPMDKLYGSPESFGGWSSNTETFRVIGRFNAITGRNYILEVELLNEISLSDSAKPRVVVHLTAYRGYKARAELLRAFSFLLFIIGVIWLLVVISRSVQRGAR